MPNTKEFVEELGLPTRLSGLKNKAGGSPLPEAAHTHCLGLLLTQHGFKPLENEEELAGIYTSGLLRIKMLYAPLTRIERIASFYVKNRQNYFYIEK